MSSLTSGKALLVIDDERCQACPLCHAKRVCKVKAIVRIDDDEAPFIDIHRCHGCMRCVVECPFEAIGSA